MGDAGGPRGTNEGLDEMPKKNMRPLTFTTINPLDVHRLRMFHPTPPLAARCRNYVLDGLFSGEFSVMNEGGHTINFTRNFNNFFQRRYKEFCYDAYDAYMTLGFVPVLLVQRVGGHKYPVVPKYGSYIIQVAYAIDGEAMYYRVWRPKSLRIYAPSGEDHSQSYGNLFQNMRGSVHANCITSYEAATGTSQFGQHSKGSLPGVAGEWVLDESVSIIGGLGADPGYLGELNSPLQSIAKEKLLTETLEDYMVDAEYKMANPPLTLQYHLTEDPDDLSAYNKEMGGAYFDATTAMTNTDEHHTATLTNEQLKKVHRFTQLTRAARNDLAGGGPDPDDPILNKLAVVGRTTLVPKGLQHVKNDSNITQVGDKYHAQKMLLDDQIAGLYGIPLPLLRNVGALRGNIAGQNDIFRNTLIKYAKMLGTICTIAFCEIYTRASSDEYELMFGCKAAVDDTQFMSYGAKKARERGVEIINDDSGSVVDPPSLNSVVVGEKIAGIDGEAEEIDESDLSDAIKQLIKENKALKAANAKMHDRKKKEDEKKWQKRQRGSARPKGTARGFDAMELDGGADLTVVLSVSHLMNDKMLQFLHQIGAIELHTFQNMMLNRLGFPASLFKSEPTDAEKMVADLLRDPSAEAPREDSTQPEGMGLEKYGTKKDQVVPAGLLMELARTGGSVEKMKANRKETEARLREKSRDEAGTAKLRKRSRDGVDKKGNVEDGAQKPAKRTKKEPAKEDKDKEKKKDTGKGKKKA